MTPNLVTPDRAKEIEQRLANSHGAKWYMDENGSWSADGYGFIADVDFMSEADEALALNCPEDLRDLLHTLAVEREENARLRKGLIATGVHHKAPCVLCGYNGPGYFQPANHECMAIEAALASREEGKDGNG